jgi:hypothetical protein
MTWITISTVGSKQDIVHGRSSFSTVAFTTKQIFWRNTNNKIVLFCMVQQPQVFLSKLHVRVIPLRNDQFQIVQPSFSWMSSLEPAFYHKEIEWVMSMQ